MTSKEVYRSQTTYARIAGFTYIFIIITYIIGNLLMSPLEVSSNFAATASHILTAEHQYRLGIFSQFITSLFTIFLAVGLYIAVKPINKNLALLALTFRLAEATIGGACFYINFIQVKLYTSPEYAAAFNPVQLATLVKLWSAGFGAAFNLSAIFFSFGSTIFFYLFYKGRSIPRLLSILGIVTSIVITFVCFTKLVFPQYSDIADYGWHPMGFVELITGLWLLFKGVKAPENQTD